MPGLDCLVVKGEWPLGKEEEKQIRRKTESDVKI